MNEVYVEYWCPLQNFFIPSMKLLRKTRIGGRIKKEYDDAKTPYQRLMDCPETTEDKREELRNKRATLNPFKLQDGLEIRLRQFQELLRQKTTGISLAA